MELDRRLIYKLSALQILPTEKMLTYTGEAGGGVFMKSAPTGKTIKL